MNIPSDYEVVTVVNSNIDDCIKHLKGCDYLSIDPETTGLKPHHGDLMYSFAISDGVVVYFFNFNEYPISSCLILNEEHFPKIRDLFSTKGITWFIHQARFDCAILANDNLNIKGEIWCTLTQARVENNERSSYKLKDLAKLVGMEKDNAVDDYIKKNKLYDSSGKKQFNRVPYDINKKYNCQDAWITYWLGKYQIESISKYDMLHSSYEKHKPLMNIADNESRLTKTLLKVEKIGAYVDIEFTKKALDHCENKMLAAKENFEKITGKEFIMSGNVYGEIFKSERKRWGKTSKGNPSFTADILAKFEHPAAKCILDYKQAHTDSNFYRGFLSAATKNSTIHTEFKSWGTRTGRFSSANPNLQNLKKDSELSQGEFSVRRAIKPRDGFVFVMIDYDQMEYRMMIDLAGARSIAKKVLSGLDVHEATAQGSNISRAQAKAVNFGILYGQGDEALAESLKVTKAKAYAIKQSIFRSAPEIKYFIDYVKNKARSTGRITNVYGRNYIFNDKSKVYIAPNTVIQGGCADAMKFAMNKIDDFLEDKKSRMILQIHDELVFEIHETELFLVEHLVQIMSSVYKHRILPLTVSVDHSRVSLADKVSGFPV